MAKPKVGTSFHFRAVGRSENPGVPALFCGHNLPLLVEIGLTGLPKSGGAMAPSAPQGMTGLHNIEYLISLTFMTRRKDLWLKVIGCKRNFDFAE